MGGGGLLFIVVPLILFIENASADQRSAGCEEMKSTVANSSPTQLLMELTTPCRYDRWTRPPTAHKAPLIVRTRVYVYFLGSIEAQTLFSAHIMVRFRWRDTRLAYSDIAADVPRLLGEKALRDQIWVPHVYLVNEHESHVMGSDREDIVMTVLPDGTTLFSTRMKVTMLCIMNLQKFPFDQQVCPMLFESWSYNTTDMILEWEMDNPVALNEDMHLTEYSLSEFWTNETEREYRISHDETLDAQFHDEHGGKFVGNFSRLIVSFRLKREVGHYIMDYYVPSILLVVVSWVSFWLDPNAVPGRTTLGTSTMLTFITLTRNTGSPLPKVSYIKATEIWFMVCTAFIFGSLVEFAFVNTIWRRKDNVELKKVNSKYIFKSTLTPTLHRKQLATSLERCRSCPDMADENESPTSMKLHNNRSSVISGYSNQLTVTSMDSICREPFPSTFSIQEGADCQDVVVPVPRSGRDSKSQRQQRQQQQQRAPTAFTTMTPQQIAQWIDRRSRVVFPLSFIVFNFLYWGFVWL